MSSTRPSRLPPFRNPAAPRAVAAPAEALAWLILWSDVNATTGETVERRTVHRHNAVADYRTVDPAARVVPLYAGVPKQASSFQARVSGWMGQCFVPSLYSNMTERGDRLLEEVLELLQAHGYDSARVSTLVDYVYGRPVGEPAQEVGGVMVTLAAYCAVAGLDMDPNGEAELARINQPEVMARIRAKQEAKNALHFDTPLPGDAGVGSGEWPREGDLIRYGDGASALAIRLSPHAGGWHGYQCCGRYHFFTKAYRPSREDMQTWLDCAKYRDERTKEADEHVARQLALIDSARDEAPGVDRG